MINGVTKGFVRAASAACILGVAAPSYGAGFALLEQSASRLGTAFAGTAATGEDLTTLYFNPAALQELSRTEATVLLSAIDISSRFKDRGSSAAFGQSLGNSGGDAGDWNFVPSAYLAVPFGDKLAAGVSINVPFGLQLEYDSGWIGRFQALNSEIATINVNPAVSYRVNDRLAVGVGLNYQRLEAELTNAVNYSAVVAQGLQGLVGAGELSADSLPGLLLANAGLEGHTRVEGDDASWGYNLGVWFALSQQTRIGLAYRSAIDYDVAGTVRFTAPAAPAGPGAVIIASAAGPGGPLSDGPVALNLKVPASTTFSIAQRLGSRFELLFDAALTEWSSVQELRLVRSSGTVLSVTPERWEDAWRFALGGTFELDPQWQLRMGVAHDETPVPESTRTARLPDADRTWLAVGARWSPAEAWTVDAAYAHLFIEDAPLDQDDGNAAAFGRLEGQVESNIDILSVQFAYRF